MLNAQSLDDLAARIAGLFEASPARDLEKNVKAMLRSGLARLDVVTRADFDVQAEVLARTRAAVDALEARIAALEGRTPGHPGAG